MDYAIVQAILKVAGEAIQDHSTIVCDQLVQTGTYRVRHNQLDSHGH